MPVKKPRIENQRCIIALKGRVSGDDIPRLAREIEHFGASNCTELVLDFADIQFIDSMGLGGMIFGVRSIENCGKTMKIVHTPEAMKTVLEDACLDRIFSIE